MLFLASQRPPAREEIIARARTYGMVFREEVVPLAPAPGTDDTSRQGSGAAVTPADAGAGAATPASGAPATTGAAVSPGVAAAVNPSPPAGTPPADGPLLPAGTPPADGPPPPDGTTLADGQPPPAGTAGAQEILVTIPAGSGLEEIAALLEQKGVVAAAAFAAEVHRRDLGEKLKAGSYYLPAGDVQEIIRRLTR